MERNIGLGLQVEGAGTRVEAREAREVKAS